MKKLIKIGNLTPTTRVRLTRDFKNGLGVVCAKAGSLGTVVGKKERGTDVYPVEVDEPSVKIYPLREYLEPV